MDVEELEEQERELNKRIDSAVEMANNQLKRHKDKIQKVIEIQCRARSHPAYDDAAQRFLEDYAAWDEQRRFEEKIILGKIYDKKGNLQIHLPIQLKGLQEGEKLLIQQVSAYVPLLHLQDGQIGSKGHVCSFVQDISTVCTVLPRLPNDVQFVKVCKKYLQEGGTTASKMFVIRKK